MRTAIDYFAYFSRLEYWATHSYGSYLSRFAYNQIRQDKPIGSKRAKYTLPATHAYLNRYHAISLATSL